jgi:hypothetical protein
LNATQELTPNPDSDAIHRRPCSDAANTSLLQDDDNILMLVGGRALQYRIV